MYYNYVFDAKCLPASMLEARMLCTAKDVRPNTYDEEWCTLSFGLCRQSN
jgi:hypothetical protein